MTALGSSSMHLTHTYDASIRLCIGTAWVARLMRWIYKGIHSASNYFTGALFFTMAIPIGSLLYLIVLYFNKRLTSTFNTNFSLDSTNCEKKWRGKVKLDEIVSQIKYIPALPIQKEAWYVRLFLKQLIKAVNAILLYHAELEKKFQHLDSPYAPLPKNMKVVVSAELYHARVKGYEYLI